VVPPRHYKATHYDSGQLMELSAEQTSRPDESLDRLFSDYPFLVRRNLKAPGIRMKTSGSKRPRHEHQNNRRIRHSYDQESLRFLTGETR